MEIGYDLFCAKCQEIVKGDLNGFKTHLRRPDHLPPFVCGQGGCCFDFWLRRSLYDHIRVHHPHPLIQAPNVIQDIPINPNLPHDNEVLTNSPVSVLGSGDTANNSDQDIIMEENVLENVPSVNLVESAERAVLKLRSITYMTGVAIETVESQAFSLMQDTAAHLKAKVEEYLQKPDRTKQDEENLLSSFSLEDPFKHIKTKRQQMNIFEEKYGLQKPKEINLGHRLDTRQNPKRPCLEARQMPTSFQYLSIKDILRAVLSDPQLRGLILSEKASDDGLMRNFRDGSLFHKLPPDLKDAIRIVIYVDDLEVLQALSASAGVYKISGKYFGIQNFPPELNSLLNFVFVVALSYAADIKNEKVWEPFLNDMKDLETHGIEIFIDGNPVVFKVVLVAQIGDSLAASEILGFRHASANRFCRLCYIDRKEMWENGLKVGEPRTPEKHAADVLAASISEANKKATGVDGPSLLHGFRFFETAGHSVFDVFHDLFQGVNKMEIKLALHHYVCVKKYFTITELKSRIQFFDYGSVDKKNKPTTNFSEDYLKNISSYNLHQSGSQVWCLTRTFPFLFADLVPNDDPFMELISLLNQIMKIVLSHAIGEQDLLNLERLIEQHHTQFMKIFPGHPDSAEGRMGDNNEDTEQQEEETREEQGFQDFFDHTDDEHDEQEATGGGGDSAPQRSKKQPKVVRMLNKHHHMVHYVELIRKFGPLILYWCIRYEARHFFFKLIATVSHNHQNLLKTLMEMLQMKLASDKQEPKSRLIMGKRGTQLVAVTSSQHCAELQTAGLCEFSSVFHVQKVSYNGVEFRPYLFVTDELEKVGCHPKFSRVEGIYVSENQKSVYLIVKQWKTVRFEAKYCAFEVQPDGTANAFVKQPEDLPAYRPIAQWKRYDSDKLYLAPRTIA